MTERDGSNGGGSRGVEQEYPLSESILQVLFLSSTGYIRISCHATLGSISGQQCYEFGVNVMQQSGLVWSRLSYSDQYN